MAAKKKSISTVPANPGEARLEILAYAPPPARPAGRIVGEGAAAAAELVRVLRQEAKVI
jgi:electron transfer flavoprotein beta subunit